MIKLFMVAFQVQDVQHNPFTNVHFPPPLYPVSLQPLSYFCDRSITFKFLFVGCNSNFKLNFICQVGKYYFKIYINFAGMIVQWVGYMPYIWLSDLIPGFPYGLKPARTDS